MPLAQLQYRSEHFLTNRQQLMQENQKQILIEKLLHSIRSRPVPAASNGVQKTLDESSLAQTFYELISEATGDNHKSEQKQVTILLADLRGFSSMSEKHTAEELIDLLNRYFHKMSEIILHYGGTIDKFMGDSVMALFGAPSSGEDDLERALACAVEMQLAMNEVNATNNALGLPNIYMGIGLNTGTVVAGNLGSKLHSEYTVIGNEVNLTSRIEAHSLRGQIMLSESTYDLAEDYVSVGTINDVLVKGRSKSVRLYELLSTSRPRTLEVPQREIRKSPRIAVNMPLNFQTVAGKTVQTEEYEGRINNISYNGMMAVLPMPIQPSAEIKIHFALSMMSNQTSEIYAKVLHVQELDNQFYCQLEFTFINDDAQRELKEFIDRIIESN